MTVVGSTFSNNEAALGSAVFNCLGGRTGDRVGGRLMVRNSTFSVNVARSYGGRLYKQFGHDSPSLVSVEGSTFANNSAARAGGGLYHRGSSNFFLRMTIVAGNEAPESPDVSGGFSSGG